ncbi:MAG: hypothetical protein IJ217_05085 [Clostridia bacterium]|nr:hypothetical protein [Clostridia bacterium]
MNNVTFIIGNGFDLDLKLRSSFNDFADSDEWKTLANFANETYVGKYEKFRQYSLLLHLSNAKETSNWFNIEEEISTYIKENCYCPNIYVELVHSEFTLLKDKLKEYIKRISSTYATNDKCIAYTLLNCLQTIECPVDIFSFNYTDCFQLCNILQNVQKTSYTHMHKTIKDEDIVLGCRIMPFMPSKKEFSFFYKFNMIDSANHLYKKLIESQEIIIFGHSLNMIDYCYFEDYFKWISSPNGMPVHLTFITLNKKTEREIRDNIGEETIIKMHYYLQSVDFIHTKSIYEGQMDDCTKWENLLKRLSQ